MKVWFALTSPEKPGAVKGPSQRTKSHPFVTARTSQFHRKDALLNEPASLSIGEREVICMMATRTRIICLAAWCLLTTQLINADVEIRGFRDLASGFSPQEDPVACWAASMSAALKVKGIDLDQDEVKKAVNGSAGVGALSHPIDMATGINRLAEDDPRLTGIQVSRPIALIDWQNFKKQIREGNPILYMYWLSPTSAHCIIVYGAVTDDSGQATDFKIWDPEPNVGLTTEPVETLRAHGWLSMIVSGDTLSTPDTISSSQKNSSSGRASNSNSEAEQTPRYSQVDELSDEISLVLTSYPDFSSITGDLKFETDSYSYSHGTQSIFDDTGFIKVSKDGSFPPQLVYKFDEQSYSEANQRCWDIHRALRQLIDNTWTHSSHFEHDGDHAKIEVYTQQASPHRRITISLIPDGTRAYVHLTFDTQ